MMKANELRIGNWVHEPVIGYCQIEVIEYNNCLVGDSSDTAYNILLTGLEPIPLTPEILIACGFPLAEHQRMGAIVYENNKFDIWLYKYDGKSSYTCSCSPDGGKPIEYLHQLQNLYFALTGEELDINL